MILKKRVLGLVSFCVGLGMLLAIMIPTWTAFIAIMLLSAGFWNLFLCG